MTNILVTGGAGYIGSQVVRELLRQNHQPVVFDNLQTGHQDSVKGALFIEGDLSSHKKLEEAFQSYPLDAVIHFAADCLVGESVQNPTKYFNNNVKNGLNLIEIMEIFGVRKIIFSSSAAVYGDPNTVPIREDHPCHPMNPYGETKWIFEKVLQAYHEAGKLDFIALRYFNAAGADLDGRSGEDHSPETHLIPLVIQAALSGRAVSVFGTDYPTPDGTCIRDYIHITDLAHAHLLALKKLEHQGISAVYNLGNGNGFSVKEVIDTVRKISGKEIASVDSPRRTGDPARLVASSKKIREELGWAPSFPDLETIVASAWEWHQNHPKGYNDKS
jgi:UDP-glucose 4-epimerase